MHGAPKSPIPWFGGKYYLRKEIIKYLPETSTYCEPFGGAASVMLAKKPVKCEIYNDIDGFLVNVFEVIQKQKQALEDMLWATLYSREQYRLAIEMILNHGKYSNVQKAWAMIVCHSQGFAGVNSTKDSRWAFDKEASGPKAFSKKHELLEAVRERFKFVFVENMTWTYCIKKYGNVTPDTLLYCDPPYLPHTRKAKKVYRHEMSVGNHEELLAVLIKSPAAVALSGYRSDMYDELVSNHGWLRLEFNINAHSANSNKGGREDTKAKRVDCLYINPKCYSMQTAEYLPTYTNH